MRETPLEKCARRMTATLARPPRHPKSRALLAQLPKRERVIVRPDDYITATFQPVRVEHSFLAEPAPRKDRMRPSAEPGCTSPMRRRLFDAQDGQCGACGYQMGEDVTIDHVVPKALGGANHHSNYLAMHGKCNNAKADRMPNAFEISMNERKNEQMS